MHDVDNVMRVVINVMQKQNTWVKKNADKKWNIKKYFHDFSVFSVVDYQHPWHHHCRCFLHYWMMLSLLHWSLLYSPYHSESCTHKNMATKQDLTRWDYQTPISDEHLGLTQLQVQGRVALGVVGRGYRIKVSKKF